MSATMWQEIRKAFEWVDRTPEARVAVLQAEGKFFTAGIDLQMMMGMNAQIANDCDGRAREHAEAPASVQGLMAPSNPVIFSGSIADAGSSSGMNVTFL